MNKQRGEVRDILSLLNTTKQETICLNGCQSCQSRSRELLLHPGHMFNPQCGSCLQESSYVLPTPEQRQGFPSPAPVMANGPEGRLLLHHVNSSRR